MASGKWLADEDFKTWFYASAHRADAEMGAVLYEAWNAARAHPIPELLHAADFLRDTSKNWDCDVGANDSHPSYCRCCNAEKLWEALPEHIREQAHYPSPFDT